MRTTINQRALRAMVASLLQTDLSPNELRRLAQDLDDPEAVQHLQRTIYQLAESLRQSEGPRSDSKSDDAERSLLDFIQRKRLSKSAARERMMAIAPNIRFDGDPEATTMRGMVSAFTRLGSNKVAQFIKSFGEETPDDPYLKGIIGRDRR